MVWLYLFTQVYHDLSAQREADDRELARQFQDIEAGVRKSGMFLALD